ncbi:hypothetical protein, partial [Clostridium sp. HBUAS56010]|uniref:hypothetical protein n=1 Tax=Clostridium sp. HBUAS56010 TaxID=2571127 RepID=UPI001A9B694A
PFAASREINFGFSCPPPPFALTLTGGVISVTFSRKLFETFLRIKKDTLTERFVCLRTFIIFLMYCKKAYKCFLLSINEKCFFYYSNKTKRNF